MSKEDFEVLPRGTMEELKVLRKFANEMIALTAIHDMPVPHEMRTKINDVARFYSSHVEKYPVNV
jgi:hypothetical protein